VEGWKNSERVDTDPEGVEILVHETSGSEAEDENLDWWVSRLMGRKKKLTNELTTRATSPSPNQPNPKPNPKLNARQWRGDAKSNLLKRNDAKSIPGHRPTQSLIRVTYR
jgi:hypothetical protein